MAWTLCAVTDENQVNTVAQVAQEIWHQHYGDLLGKDQVDYMVDRFQSAPAISRQLREEGYRYYLVLVDGKPNGYVGLVPEGDRLFLSKLYLRAQVRGQGDCRGVMDFLCNLCRLEGYQTICLPSTNTMPGPSRFTSIWAFGQWTARWRILAAAM